MEFADVVRRRRMVRDYDPDRPVPAEVVDRVLAHALRGPSAGFTQGYGLLVLETPADRDRFWAAATPPGTPPNRWLTGMRRAPLIVLPHGDRSAYLDRYARPDKGWTDRDPARWPVPYWHVDAGFAALLALLTAVDSGLGACFFGVPAAGLDAYRAAFDVPADLVPVGAVTVGYPAPGHRSRPLGGRRRPAAEMIHRGRWGR